MDGPPSEGVPPAAGLPLEALADCCPPAGPPLAGDPLAGELLEALLGAPEAEALEALLGALLLLEEALLDDALLEAELLDELLDEELLLDDALAVCSSSEKSISSGGSPSLLEDGSGGIRDSSARWSESVYTGEDSPRLLLLGSALLGSALLLARCERLLDCSPLLEDALACSLERSPDSTLGIELLGCEGLLAVEILGLELELLGELGDGMLLAVDGLEDELLEDDCDWDCDCD
ncbi:hypothetical protein [Microbulbifer celer]|uniref:Uncharacterized protein n=1 Tax=Microbulbifer celer TaxID=435905 RepID=A0ABW3U438_9GAMM|nr:hypothetical protein [Microbulbifer celer]UFN56173.1 hypothetical protein LPW13_11365 [Microbulbifer celer]